MKEELTKEDIRAAIETLKNNPVPESKIKPFPTPEDWARWYQHKSNKEAYLESLEDNEE